jgi:glycerol-3-phosphate acyltransferase PlsY
MGWGAAALTLIGDVAKGALAVWLGSLVSPGGARRGEWPRMANGCWPVFLRFRGGKGVATGFGALLVLMPWPWRRRPWCGLPSPRASATSRLGSVLAALCVPLGAVMLGYPWSSVGACAVVAATIVARHRENVSRLLAGTERRLGERTA